MTRSQLRPLSRRTRLASGLALAVAAALIAAPSSTVGAEPDAPSVAEVPNDQPFPGYTVVNPPLEPLTIRGKRTRVFQGVHQHAAYTVERPRRWNGELVMWAHGFRGETRDLTVDPPGFGLREQLLRQGYAWAASSYARNDYDVASGVRTTRGLVGKARQLIGRPPLRTYIAGVSMGGHVIGRSLEEYPGLYDGALPMCGVMGDQRLFDYFLGYNLLAQDLADVDANPPRPDYLTDSVPQIQQNLGIGATSPENPEIGNDLGRQLRALTTELSGGERPGSQAAFGQWKDFLFTLFTPDNGGSLAQNPGRVAGNRGVNYRPASPVDVNASVVRLAARDDFSRNTSSLTQIPRIAGRPGVPTLTLHGLGDLFVPFSMERIYRKEVRRQGQSRLLVQRAIRSAGHCEFTDREVGGAWNDLTAWVEGPRRNRPAGDNVLRTATVADPSYGCRFTDPTGYQQSEQYPSRTLYERCD